MVNGILVRVDEFWFFEPRFTMIVYIKFPVQLAKFWTEWKGSRYKKNCVCKRCCSCICAVSDLLTVCPGPPWNICSVQLQA